MMTYIPKPTHPRAFIIIALCAALIYTLLNISPALASNITENIRSGEGVDKLTFLESGSTHRYSFTHHKSLKPELKSKVVIQLKSDVPNAFSFDVKRSDTMQTVGTSIQLSKLTKQNRDESIQIWVGGTASETITLYVDVINKSPYRSAYQLEITSKDISFSADANRPIALSILDESEPLMVPNVRKSPGIQGPQRQLSRTGLSKLKKPARDVPGSSPTNALNIDNDEWLILQSGEKRWYAFDNDFDQHAKSPQLTIIELETEVVDALSFAVITSRMKIIGVGVSQDQLTGNARDDSRIIWTSGTLISGRYFVEINNYSQAPVRFNLSLEKP